MFLYAIIAPVFPFSLVDRVGVVPSLVQYWTSVLYSVYGAGLLVSAPISGYLSDMVVSRRTPLLAGIFILGSATVMLCLARSLRLLIFGRVLQGASSGVLWVVALALLADTVGDQNAGRAMGYVGAAYSAAALIAPLLGGAVYHKFGYYAVFVMTFGMIMLDISLRLFLVEKKRAEKWLHQEHASASHDTLELSLEKQGNITVASIHIIVSDMDVAQQQEVFEPGKNKTPAILILLKSRRMQATFWATTVTAMVLTGFDTTLPLFVEQTFGWSSRGAGLIFLAPLSASFLQPLYGSLVDREGPRIIAFAGLVMCVPPWVCLRFVTSNSMSHKVLFCFLLFVIGLGSSFTMAGGMAEFTYICAEKERKAPGSMGKGGAYAQSYALFNVTWALGGLIGAFLAGGIRQNAGWGTMTWAFALLCGIFSAPTLLWMDGWIGNSAKKHAERKRARLEQGSARAARNKGDH